MATNNAMQAHTNTENPTGLRSTKAVARDLGVSTFTVWRYRKNGWLEVVNICGKPFVTSESLARFRARALTGEFARALHGIAAAK